MLHHVHWIDNEQENFASYIGKNVPILGKQLF